MAQSIFIYTILKGLYSVFFAVERFPYLRDFLNYFGLIDFFIKVSKISLIKFSKISLLEV